ncbi:MAG: hypothetical protein ABW168_08460 [Sedimenticola sp.]
MKVTGKSILVAILLLPITASAFTWGNQVNITGIYVYADGDAIIRTSANQNPDNCITSAYLVISKDSVNFKMLYSSALAAYTSGKTVSINYDGCKGNYPIVNSVASPAIW